MAAVSVLPKKESPVVEQAPRSLAELAAALNDPWTRAALAGTPLTGAEIDRLTGATDAAEAERQLGEVDKALEQNRKILVDQIGESETSLEKLNERIRTAEAATEPEPPQAPDAKNPKTFELYPALVKKFETAVSAYLETKASLPKLREQAEALQTTITTMKRQQMERENDATVRRVEWQARAADARSADLTRALLDRHAKASALAESDAKVAAFVFSVAIGRVIELAGTHLKGQHAIDARRQSAEEVAKVEAAVATALFQVGRDVRDLAHGLIEPVASCERYKGQVTSLLGGLNAVELQRFVDVAAVLAAQPNPPPPESLKLLPQDLLEQKAACEKQLKETIRRTAQIGNEIANELPGVRGIISKTLPEVETALHNIDGAAQRARARAFEVQALLKIAEIGGTTYPTFAQLIASCIESLGGRLGKSVVELASSAAAAGQNVGDLRRLRDAHPATKYLAARESLDNALAILTERRSEYTKTIDEIERTPREVAKKIERRSGMAAIACALPLINLFAGFLWLAMVEKYRHVLATKHDIYIAARRDVLKTLRTSTLLSITALVLTGGWAAAAWPGFWPVPTCYAIAAGFTTVAQLWLYTASSQPQK